MGFTLTSVEDPESTEPILEAHCEIIEYHVNYLDKQVTAVVGVWRTKAAYDNKRKFAAAITIPLAPDWAVKWLEKRQVETINLPQELQLLEAACLKLLEKQNKV